MSLAPERDSLEFLGGAALGALLGAGVALLAAPDRSPPARVRRRIRRPRRALMRRARRTREAEKEVARRWGGLLAASASLGGEFARAVREELVADGLARARGRARPRSPAGRASLLLRGLKDRLADPRRR